LADAILTPTREPSLLSSQVQQRPGHPPSPNEGGQVIRGKEERFRVTGSSDTQVTGNPAPGSFGFNFRHPGALDGLTIARFSHAYDSIGGLQKHLQGLNRALLERNAFTIIQMYRTEDEDNLQPKSESIGRGTLITVPILSTTQEPSVTAAKLESRIYNAITLMLVGLGIRDVMRMRLEKENRLTLLLARLPVAREFYYRTGLKFGDLQIAQRVLADVFAQHTVDLIIAHSPFLIRITKAIVEEAHQRGIPIIVQNHTDNGRLSGYIDKRMFSRLDGIAGVSGVGVPHRLAPFFTHLSNGIDTEFFRPDKAASFPMCCDDPIILLPGRICSAKGHLEFLKIVKTVRNWGIRVRVICAGKEAPTGFQEEMMNQARRYGIADSIKFAGALSPGDLRDYYAVSSIAVAPSRRQANEGMPRVILEAQAMERPVVAFDVSGVRDALIDGVTGYLVKSGDTKGFARCLKRLLLDPQKRIEMGRAGRTSVERKFNLAALAQRHENLYVNILVSRSPRS